MVEMDENHAVVVTGAYKQYGSSTRVLKGLNMTVAKGTIYGLLGASGCGKTTLLNCIVGIGSLNYGSINICIKERSRLGYMPQDLALFEEFSIEETFFYYGRIYDLSAMHIKERIKFLVTLLQIPNLKKLISCCSGGQQRRISFATALLPNPDLLILDEPTAGQDPILCHSIWEYLIELTHENKTVIITTHYIEEARQANAVGFMHNGVLLDEGSPTQLMSHYNCNTLEETFLHLCIHNRNKLTGVEHTIEVPKIKSEATSRPFKKGNKISYRRMISQWNKNYLYIKKHVLLNYLTYAHLGKDIPKYSPLLETAINENKLHNKSVLLLIVMLPMVEVLILTVCIGNPPIDLPVSVVNLEINGSCFAERYTNRCDKSLGCRFIDQIVQKGLYITEYSNKVQSMNVRPNKVWASIIIPENFTALTDERFTLGRSTPDANIDTSFITAAVDKTNMIVTAHVYRTLIDSITDAVLSWNKDCSWPLRSDVPPVMVMDPVYGIHTTTFVDFMSPGILCLFQFALSYIFSLCALLYEKSSGTIDRSLVAGVLWLEIILAHITIAVVFTAAQTIVMMFIMFYIRNIYYYGSMVLTFLLVLLQGFSGMGCGIFIAVAFKNEPAALNFSLGFIVSIIFLTGVLWPTEGMHWIAAYVSKIVPTIVPVQSLRSIVARGHTLQSPLVFKGFIYSLGWISFFVLISIFIMRRKDK